MAPDSGTVASIFKSSCSVGDCFSALRPAATHRQISQGCSPSKVVCTASDRVPARARDSSIEAQPTD